MYTGGAAIVTICYVSRRVGGFVILSIIMSFASNLENI